MYSARNSRSFKHTVSGRLVISVSCTVDTEQTKGTEMLYVLLSCAPDFVSGQAERQIPQKDLCPSRTGSKQHTDIECLLLILL